jgi:hypothetical protein
MTDKRSILINFRPIQTGTHSVHGIGNTCLEAKGRGDVEVDMPQEQLYYLKMSYLSLAWE